MSEDQKYIDRLRDEFAIAALDRASPSPADSDYHASIAKEAYRMANALLAERQRHTGRKL